VAAQNVHPAVEGAFTGEISGVMLKEVGCAFVLVGHSERRHILGESDQTVAQKFIQALQASLTPVLCVGETLAEFEAGQAETVIKRQLEIIPQGSSPYLIAYEPVWAIGTGKTATPAYAEKIHHFIQQCLTNRTPILYGGSVNAENANTLLDSPNIDGVLVGGASLVPQEFVKIVMT
jgi:triosephosphate isomerase